MLTDCVSAFVYSRSSALKAALDSRSNAIQDDSDNDDGDDSDSWGEESDSD